MDFFNLEILVPLVIAAVYFFGNMLSGKSDDSDDAPMGLPKRRGSEERKESDAAERQRRIQEDIRRKILERRGAAGGSGPARRPAAPVARRDLREPRRETPEMRKEAREVVHETREAARPAMAPPMRAAPAEPAPPDFTWDRSDDVYEESMKARLEQIEAAKRQTEQLRKQASAVHERTGAGRSRRGRKQGRYFSGPVRDSLGDPRAARAAFVYAEALGPPVSLRQRSNVPGLN